MEKYDVFISYSRADYKDANNVPIPGNVISKITTELQRQNISFWIDEDGIYTGDNFAPKIAKAIESSQVFVFVSSENSNKSPWTQNEVCVAQSYKKPILPLKCDDSAYAVSVIMYLAMLDYCDYKSQGDRAIIQLVDSIKEKLPSKSQIEDIQILQQNDREYKKAVLGSLDEINHQIVDISQIAVGQVLEANQRNRDALNEIGGIIKGVCLEITENRDIVAHQIIDRIDRSFQELIHTTKDNNHALCTCIEHLISIAEESRQFSKIAIKMFENFLDASKENYEARKSDDNPVANIIFVCDVSGSMVGDKIDGVNYAIKTILSKDGMTEDQREVKTKISILSFSEQATFSTNLTVNNFAPLKAGGLSNFGNALIVLDKKLKNPEITKSCALTQTYPLIIFITDGQSTDGTSLPLQSLKKNEIFNHCQKVGIAIGDDVDMDLMSNLTDKLHKRKDGHIFNSLALVIGGYLSRIAYINKKATNKQNIFGFKNRTK